MRETNLFNYATSELSQDAFICWLMSHAKVGNQNINPEITKCALDFIHAIPQLNNAKNISEIQRQYSVRNVRIDILLTIDNYKVIIEDKIDKAATDFQIQSQKDALAEKFPSSQIICVFYKTVEQWYTPKVADKIFYSSDLLSIFGKYKRTINSDIFSDYVEYLENFEYEKNLYITLPINEWWSMPYIGFFKYLTNSAIVPQNSWWDYVPNPSGGFMCLCWHPLNNSELDQIGLTEDYCDEFYLQIENNKIAVKISADVKTYDKNKVTYARQKILEYFQNRISIFEKPSRQVFSTWMTVGYIYYDEKNYAEKIKLMNDIFVEMKAKFKLTPIS